MNIRINTQHRFTVSKMPFYCQRKAVSLVAKRPFTTSTLKVHIHSYTSMGRAKVTFHSFRSHLPLVPKSVLGGKVTWERTESDLPSGGR